MVINLANNYIHRKIIYYTINKYYVANLWGKICINLKKYIFFCIETKILYNNIQRWNYMDLSKIKTKLSNFNL
jgi:hypothetical protein